MAVYLLVQNESNNDEMWQNTSYFEKTCYIPIPITSYLLQHVFAFLFVLILLHYSFIVLSVFSVYIMML